MMTTIISQTSLSHGLPGAGNPGKGGGNMKKTITVYYGLTEAGQKKEIINGREGDKIRAGKIILDEEMLSSGYVHVDEYGCIVIEDHYHDHDGIGGYIVVLEGAHAIVKSQALGRYICAEKLLSDEELTQIYRRAIVRRYAEEEAAYINKLIKEGRLLVGK